MKNVAVITRTRNRALLLRRAARSVERQTFRDFSWVVVNDGGDGEEVKPVPDVLVALVEDIDPEPDDDVIDITSNQAPPPVC